MLSLLAVTDIGFLFTLVLINFRHFSFDILNAYELICKLSVYFNYLFGFLSAWLVVLFSIERLIAVYMPMELNDICTATLHKICLITITFIGLILYSFNLFATGLQKSYSQEECVPLDFWIYFAKYMTLVDIIATMVLPFILISIINLLIICELSRCKLLYSVKKSTSISKERATTVNFIEMHSIIPISGQLVSKLSGKNSYSPKMHSLRSKSCVSTMTVSNMKKRKEVSFKTTKTLLCISTAFLILNGPIATTKIYYLLKHDFFGQSKVMGKSHTTYAHENEIENALNLTIFFNFTQNTRLNMTFRDPDNKSEKLAGMLTSNLYYLNFVLNFFLYTLNGTKFRQLLFGMFKRKRTHLKKIKKREIRF